MEPRILHHEIAGMIDGFPDFERYSNTSRDLQQWLARAHATLGKYKKMEATRFRNATEQLHVEAFRSGAIDKMVQILHLAAADLESQIPSGADQVFGPGAVYDFFKALSDLLSGAQTSIFIVDPYLDASIFDAYLSPIPKSVAVRLLTARNSDELKTALERYNQQHSVSVAIRRTKSIHDRIIMVDNEDCWLLGQSIKDAATKKITYLAPLDGDVAPQKLTLYENAWNNATQI